ncbi:MULTISPECIES: hypothetical protein [Petrotoga]|uniref:Uncharacterized protein n=4 Tax=Petrotoga TaxID=28236 RepID=A0A4R8EZ52_9BACT|nr:MULTISPECIES: hypothetical protein [Petrotoga]KUK81953.1 MAG: Uncharacterized protein XD96_0990 [Petrotoga mobilis]PNR98135.1 hypothetical protein X929_01625 [Petrotoga olearia DSM 13574]POZ87871.1 hypothetical protein AA80_09150 [Petrotoga sibirica DSM 13575]POZ89942.1 hypothetical protein AD60_09190 [Petrotoga sp. SL27]RMA75677.1 hypothetical protein C8D75_0690 [Petrotoga olearia]
MVSTLKYSLFFTIIIIVASISFAIDEETTVPIYLTVPEYLKITDLSKTRLDLNVDNNFKDSLTFNVEANVEYNLGAEFTVLQDPHENPQANLVIKSSHLSISNGENLWESEEGSSQDTTIGIQEIQGTPGSLGYSLTFWLVEGGWIYNASGRKIGDIQITVSSL